MGTVTRWAALVAGSMVTGLFTSARDHQHVHQLATWLIPAALLAAGGLLVVLARKA